jgi:cysteine desulfurase
MKPIYLDYNATTPIDSEVAAEMLPYLEEHFGNPSSSHWYGTQTKLAVEKARAQVASLLDCQSDEIVFTSGGSESNNLAIQGIAYELRAKGNHIITSTIEHPAVMEVCKHLGSIGFEISYLPVDAHGMVRAEDVAECIKPSTILISIMHANNEVGTIQPIAEVSSIAKQHGIVLHSDAAQSVGKIPVQVNELDIDLLSVAGHKLYAPKGIGALYIRSGTTLKKLIHGANHERGIRAGTENVLEIVGLGKACQIAEQDMNSNVMHMRTMRDRMYDGLLRMFPDLPRNGHPELCLPNTLSVSFPHIEADTLLSKVQNIAASAGAACHSDTIELSSVLKAMGVNPEQAMGTVRFSTGRKTTAQDIDTAVQEITAAIQRLQSGSDENRGPDVTITKSS